MEQSTRLPAAASAARGAQGTLLHRLQGRWVSCPFSRSRYGNGKPNQDQEYQTGTNQVNEYCHRQDKHKIPTSNGHVRPGPLERPGLLLPGNTLYYPPRRHPALPPAPAGDGRPTIASADGMMHTPGRRPSRHGPRKPASTAIRPPGSSLRNYPDHSPEVSVSPEGAPQTPPRR